jgi:nucleoside-diphosphate-sugar epimerase
MHLPVVPLRTAADIIDKGTALFSIGHPGLRSALDKYTEDMAVDGHRIQAEIGFRPKYDLFSGWRETIEEMRTRGDL